MADPSSEAVHGFTVVLADIRLNSRWTIERSMSFHVPELARNTTHPQLGSDASYGNNGFFELESPEPGWRLALICSDGTQDPDLPPWEHVSVHAFRRIGGPQRTPTWKEMNYVKRLCWDGEDVVMQLHPRESEYVNCHPNVLHLWRPVRETIPTPPSIFVGVDGPSGAHVRSDR